jgi:alkylation response protein AidB-like acyl-CoA dehydrogenase
MSNGSATKLSDRERESMDVAEAARQKEWKQPSFMREMILGSFRLDLIHPFPITESERPEFVQFYEKFKQFLAEKVDAAAIDESGEYPEHVIEGLKALGAFGMKIPVEYGGLGFSQIEYCKVMELLGTHCGNVTALLSAHQSIGAPQPLKLAGSAELKQKYLPRCAKGMISAFALTEPRVGSDPARMDTIAELTPEGDAYIINGTKLWCTNGTNAELLVVMARNPKSEKKRKISTFLIETAWPGVEVTHRCHFMGLRALANAEIKMTNVRVPVANLVGKEGQGLKLALTTLNTGRLAIPASVVGISKRCLAVCREWSNERVQWGLPIGKHEAIGHKLADMSATIFAMDSIARLASEMSDRGGYDIRLEAAAAKEWNSVWGWDVVHQAMQIRSGRGYETEKSLAARGDKPTPIERLFRDSRINMIFEGSSEIMHLFMAREALDKHMQVAGTMIDPKATMGAKLAALPKVALYYAIWYPSRWLGWGRWPRYASFGRHATHLRFVERNCRKLSREVFHGMVWHGMKLQRKQGFLFRIVDIANELLAMSATISRAHQMAGSGATEAKEAQQLTDLFCRGSRRRIRTSFKALWSNDDVFKYNVSREVLKGDHAWLEDELV